MIKINDCSSNCSKSELDLFTIPPTQTDIDSYKFKTIEPDNGWKTNKAIYFKIDGTRQYFIDISATEIYCKIKGPENMLNSNKNIYPVNNIIHSLFKNVRKLEIKFLKRVKIYTHIGLILKIY